MLSDTERENVTKAAQCAALLVSEVKALAAANNPLLAELGVVSENGKNSTLRRATAFT